jgi:hypothetical protein
MDYGHQRMAGVAGAMTLIRPLFSAQGCDVSAYSDHQIAAMLLEICPEPNTWWLSRDHLISTFKRLNAGPPRS